MNENTENTQPNAQRLLVDEMVRKHVAPLYKAALANLEADGSNYFRELESLLPSNAGDEGPDLSKNSNTK